jgi:hypothetical protein
MVAVKTDNEQGQSAQQFGETLRTLGDDAGIDSDHLRSKLALSERLIAADKGASRTALLAQIDALARHGRITLGLLLLSAVFLAWLVVMFAPGPKAMVNAALLWAAGVAGAVVMPSLLLHRYHQGGAILRKPFTWRSRYTAFLSVFGFVYGSGLLLMASKGLPLLFVGVVGGAILLSGFIGAYTHRAHRSAAAAFGFSVWAALLPVPVLLFSNGALPMTQIWLSIITLIFIGGLGVLALIWQWARVSAASALYFYPRREQRHIKEERKPASQAYNPYRLKSLANRDTPEESNGATPSP